jgi:HlyD family secretion protein
MARVKATESAVERSKSTRQQAEIDYQLKQSRFERVQSLMPTQAIAQSDYDIAHAELLASQQAIQTAQFDQEIAIYELAMAQAAVQQFTDGDADTTAQPFEIFSPIAGRVLRVFQESSAVVNVGTPLIELGDPQNLEIEVDVLSTDAVRIKPGSELTIEHWGGGEPLKGYVRVIEPAAFTKISSLGVEEQRVNVIGDFHESPDRLQSLGDGYRVEANITVNELEQALLIPNSALFRFERKWHVLTVVHGKAALQPITLGLQNDTHAQVIDGLQAGDQVIVYPSDTLSPGTAVRLTAP